MVKRPSPTSVPYTAASVAAALLAMAFPTCASAGNPALTGTISCTVEGTQPGHNLGFIFRPSLGSVPRRVHIAARNDESACDGAGVTGGPPIGSVELKFAGKLLEGTCAEFTDTAQYVNARVKLKWLAADTGKKVAVSRAALASASFDGPSNAVVLTTAPITFGAFAGETATLRLGLVLDAATMNADCSSEAFVGMAFGIGHPATVDVQ
jgi:hypothetical protein